MRAVKFTIYIILITHLSACVWFLGACFRETYVTFSLLSFLLPTYRCSFLLDLDFNDATTFVISLWKRLRRDNDRDPDRWSIDDRSMLVIVSLTVSLKFLSFASNHCRCTEGSWAQHTGNTHRIAGFGDYISSLYWAAATMSSTGYGDIHAHNMESQLIATVVMLTGLLLYGYCLSSIAATLANSAAPKYVSSFT